MRNNKRRFTQASKGFTLIEMLVSIALFAIVMMVCVGALLSLVGANKKAQALESVMNNLNISLDDMVRSIREGTNFNCGDISYVNLSVTSADCSTGGTIFSFAPYGSNPTPTDPQNNQRTVYEYVSSEYNSGQLGLCGDQPNGAGCIIRSVDGGPYSSITAPEVSITSMDFYVVGTLNTDDIQPRVIITIEGTAGGLDVKESTTFHLQATAVQRTLDL